ncbi:MAG: hypothetical protein ACI8XM_001324 [Haloarculaceae archaeon]|jgi:hypothetical protein
MESVSLSRTIQAPEPVLREQITDLQPFMEAAGFDEVWVDGDRIEIDNSVGLLTIELKLRCIETDGVLAYEQVEGIFETMETRYTLTEEDGSTTVTATTDFALDVGLVGPILDGTIIARQRKKELSSQFDYLDDVAATHDSGES